MSNSQTAIHNKLTVKANCNQQMTLQLACCTGSPVVRKKNWIGEREN